MTITVRFVAVVAALAGAAFAVWPAEAAREVPIDILDNRYDPNDVAVELDPRDGSARITWSNTGANTHSVTSASGAWADSGDLPPKSPDQPPSKFVLTIQRPGIFNYYCRIHGANVMSGVLRVSGQAPPPPATTTAAPPATTTTIAPVTTTTAPPVTSTTTAPESTTTSLEETTTTSSSSTTSTTEVALGDDDDDDDESNGPLRIVGVASLLAAAAATVVQARRFLGAG